MNIINSQQVPSWYRSWFYAAAVYNALWGITACLFPASYYRIIGIDPSNPTVLFQCIGMIVGVYAFGYLLVAKNPIRYQGMVWVGLAGKVFGPIGCIYAAYTDQLPWDFLWLNLTNDIVWIPVFTMFAFRYAKHPY